MFIAFDGPDKTGKSTSAAALAASGKAIYNVTKETHAVQQQLHQEAPELPITYDRIDWFTHMVYRLALPGHEWNDPRVRTVFAMPDTHLVVKLHRPDYAERIDDELYETGKLAQVNPMYFYFADFLMGLNKAREYSLFKSVSLVEVVNDPDSEAFSQQLVAHDSPAFEWGTSYEKLVNSDETLLEMLRYVDQHIG